MVNIYCVIDSNGKVIDRIYLTPELAESWEVPEGCHLENDTEKGIDEIKPLLSPIQVAKKKIEFYSEMLATVSAENIELNLTSQQAASVVQKLIDVKAAAEVGMWDAALYYLSQVQVDELYTEARRQKHTTMIQEFLASL